MSRGATVAFVLLLGISPAHADEAKDLFDKAETEYRLGDFAHALENYKAALKLRRHPSLIFNIAQCYRQMNDPKQALFYYKLYLSDWARDNAKPPNYTEVKQHIDQLTAVIEESKKDEARKEKQPPDKARLHINGLPDGAKVLVGGVLRARGPLASPIEVAPGQQQVRVEAEGFVPWIQTVNASPGDEPTLDVTLRRPARRSRFWLASGISTGALAVGAVILGGVYNAKANGPTKDWDEYSGYRTVAITGYVMAGAFLAGSAASWFLWYRSGRTEDEYPASAAVLPTPGGAAVAGTVRF